MAATLSLTELSLAPQPAARFPLLDWQGGPSARRVQYTPEVLESLRAAADAGFRRGEQRGERVGGLLFGTRKPGAIVIGAWIPVEEFDGLPLWSSGPKQQRRIEQILKESKTDHRVRGFEPLGFFVSIVEGELRLDNEILGLYERCFPESHQVVLALRPSNQRPMTAGFFVRETDGTVQADHSYHTFTVQPLDPVEPAPAPAEPVPAMEKPAPVAVRPREQSTWWKPTVAVAALLVGMLGGMLMNEHQVRAAAPNTASLRAVPASPSFWFVSWNPSAAVLRNAASARLEVRHQNTLSTIPLTLDDLKSGGRRIENVKDQDLDIRFVVQRSKDGDFQEWLHVAQPVAAPVLEASAQPNPAELELQRLNEELAYEKAQRRELMKALKQIATRIGQSKN